MPAKRGFCPNHDAIFFKSSGCLGLSIRFAMVKCTKNRVEWALFFILL